MSANGRLTAVGQLYDVIWGLALPAERQIDPLVVRGVLWAMASHLDHTQLMGRKWYVFPSEASLAATVERGGRTIERTISYLVRRGLIVIQREAVSGGRGRPGRAALYKLPIDVWQSYPQRSLSREIATPVRVNRDTGVANTEEIATPVSRSSSEIATPVAAQPYQVVNPTTTGVNPAIEPNHARARAREEIPPDEPSSTGHARVNGRQPSLPGTLTAVPPKRERCIKCRKLQSESPGQDCRNPGWHDLPRSEAAEHTQAVANA